MTKDPIRYVRLKPDSFPGSEAEAAYARLLPRLVKDVLMWLGKQGHVGWSLTLNRKHALELTSTNSQVCQGRIVLPKTLDDDLEIAWPQKYSLSDASDIDEVLIGKLMDCDAIKVYLVEDYDKNLTVNFGSLDIAEEDYFPSCDLCSDPEVGLGELLDIRRHFTDYSCADEDVWEEYRESYDL